jgi:hypothetical protein
VKYAARQHIIDGKNKDTRKHTRIPLPNTNAHGVKKLYARKDNLITHSRKIHGFEELTFNTTEIQR